MAIATIPNKLQSRLIKRAVFVSHFALQKVSDFRIETPLGVQFDVLHRNKELAREPFQYILDKAIHCQCFGSPPAQLSWHYDHTSSN